jgi:hypothetical protein
MKQMAVPGMSLFLERAIKFLYEKFPESRKEDPDRFTEIVGAQLNKADSYGLVTEQQVMIYITSAWLLGLNFDKEFPSAKETLNSKKLPPDKKADWLAKWTEQVIAGFKKEK